MPDWCFRPPRIQYHKSKNVRLLESLFPTTLSHIQVRFIYFDRNLTCVPMSNLYHVEPAHIEAKKVFWVKAIAPDLSSAVYLDGMVCRLLRQPKGLPSAHPKSSRCGFPVKKKRIKKEKESILVGDKCLPI